MSGGSNFRNHPLCQPRLLYTGVTFGKTAPRIFHRNTVRGRLSLRPLGGYGKARKAARYRNAALPRNAAGERILLLNTDRVLLRGAGLCGRRYSRCTHCHEPHGGTVSSQTKSCNPGFLPAIASTYPAGSRLHQPDIPCQLLAESGSRLLPGRNIC